MPTRIINSLLQNGTLNSFVFQLVKMSVEVSKQSGQIIRDPIVSEIAAIELATNPSSIEYHLTNRTSTGLTKDGTPFIQKGGRGIGNLSISGTMGREARLVGNNPLPKSGDVRLREFREMIFKLGNAITGAEVAQTNPIDDRVQLNGFVESKVKGFEGFLDGDTSTVEEYFLINFFDFYNRQYYLVNIRDFRIIENVERDLMPDYQIEMELLGQIIQASTTNYLLYGLENALKEMQRIEDILAEVGKLFDNELVTRTLGTALTGGIVATYTLQQVGILKDILVKAVSNKGLLNTNPIATTISTLIRSF